MKYPYFRQPIHFHGIDHVVEAHPEHSLENVVQWYQDILGMHRFWSIDDKLVHAEFSALRAILMGNEQTDNGGNGQGPGVKVWPILS
jgi:4-hydroxyphenylpyruvate dioxygenase-like putative hemolysin